MRIRALQDGDVPALEAIGAGNGYEYPDLRDSNIEVVQVVEDEDGRIIAAAAAKRITELYLWASDVHEPITRLNALRMLHDGMAGELRKVGYSETNVFLPPKIDGSFGRRLIKSFGWQWNWKSLFLKF